MDTLSTVRIRTKKPIGFLWHFGHFMHDFLMPMNDYLPYLRPSSSYKLKVILHTGDINQNALLKGKAKPLHKDDFLGDFIGIAEKFLNIEVQYKHLKEFNSLKDVKLYPINSYSFGPYSPFTFKALMDRANEVYGVESCKEYPPVILIERGHKPLTANRLGGQWVDTGTSRRTIENHSELKEALSNKYGDSFINVVLEDMPFENQIALFRGAKLVVAQHGAGMCNIAWMVNKGATVLELPPIRFQTFVHMCAAKHLDYRVIPGGWVRSAPASTAVDVNKVMSMLSDIDASSVKL